MKTSKFLLLLLLFTGIEFTVAQESYKVTAKSGLTIRKEPNANGQKIGKLEYGMVVNILEKTDFTLTVSDNGTQIRGNWVKVSFEHIPKIIAEESTGFVFDGYLELMDLKRTSTTVAGRKEFALYKLSSTEQTANGKVGFVSLTDAYNFRDNGNSMVIANEHLGEQEFKGDNYHVLEEPYRTRFLNSLSISETDSLFIYHFLSNGVFAAKVAAIPVVAKINPYGAQTPIQPNDYLVGFEIGEAQMRLEDVKDYFSTTSVYIGEENPFAKGQLRPVLWEKVAASRFPASKVVTQDSITAEIKPPNDTFEFTTKASRYLLQNLKKNDRLYARHLKVLSTENDSVLFDKIYDPGEGAALLTLNTVRNKKKNNRIAIWTGKLFKNRPPIITDLISHSFGCPLIYFLDSSEAPIYIRCDNRH
ncbi:SH3 domain-containing protein [Aggregatimonas sangjinii]|uniref:SH3 domain-containing protein n=1 Tax=Aggregatimonas sangjinii TaxID=2583587 RepID=A0A5B7ST56_9FLAO|nr:SH3 domain-containing protein [Aggregatimonas sangjinii]QCX00198.1 SH3 domain-containing protein [Aggregatimonas sangjinii]